MLQQCVASRLLTAVAVVNPLTPWQVLKSRFVLLGVAVTAVFLVALSATVLNNFPEGGTCRVNTFGCFFPRHFFG